MTSGPDLRPDRPIAERLRWALVAAALTPMDADATVDADACAAYYERVLAGGADALAIGAHTGRGPFLPVAVRERLIRAAAGLGVPVVAGVGHDDDAGAEAAARAGADALLVLAPPRPEPDRALDAHDRLHRVSGLPMVAFDLYTRPYPLPVLRAVLDHPAVVAFKPARLHDAVACQDGIAAARSRGVLVLTGEDRMFGPSLLWGAEGALVGLASAAVPVTAAALRSFRAAGEDGAGFVRASRVLDELAAVAFGDPVDGYVQRMLWIAADEGLIDHRLAVDPYRPPDLRDDERDHVLAVARRCRAEIASLAP